MLKIIVVRMRKRADQNNQSITSETNEIKYKITEESLKSMNVKTNNEIIEKTHKVTLQQVIIGNVIVGGIALAIYFPSEFLSNFSIFGEKYYFHALLTFICFTILPIIYLLLFQVKFGKVKYFFMATTRGITKKNILTSLLYGIGMHAGIFYPWILLSQRYLENVQKIQYFLPTATDWFWQIFFVALNVIMFEYYSKAFIQLQFSEASGSLSILKKIQIKGGKLIGFILQFIVWMAGHGQELTWLPNYMGLVNAIFFIIVSGLLTGLTVLKTENIFGVTLGHILLNVFVTITYS